MSKTSGKQQQKRTGAVNKQGTKAQSKQKKPSSRDEEEEDEEDDCSESDEEDDVSRALFYYANAIITEGLTTSGMESELQSAMKALEKCKFLLLHQNPLLQKMVKKAASRDMSDNKVPPGSASVQRDLQDDRFLLSLVCIGCSKIQAIINQDMEAAVVSLKEALVFFPRSAEANENIAQLLRTQADTQEKLNSVENYFRKAMNSKEQIEKAIECSSVSLGTISLLAASKVPNTTTTSSGRSGASSSKSKSKKKSKGKKESRSDAMGNTIIEEDDDNDDSDENDDNDKNKKKNDDDDDDDDEEADQLEEEVLRNVLEMELSASLRATENLLLHLCQEGRCSEALPLLREGKYLIRLSRDVLCYKIEGESGGGEILLDDENLKNEMIGNDKVDEKMIESKKKSKNSSQNGDGKGKEVEEKEVEESSAYLRVTDGILSTNTLSHLQHVFRPSSPFWSEHQYNLIANSSRTAGYFSYVYDLRELPSNSIEQVICVLFEKVKEMFPSIKDNKNNKSGNKSSKRDSKKDAEKGGENGEGERGEGEECVYAEWWVHTRPHSSGHQLHFDSDNEGIQACAYVSCSVYLHPLLHFFSSVPFCSLNSFSSATSSYYCFYFNSNCCFY